MLIAQTLFSLGQAEFGLMAQMWPTIVSQKGSSNAIVEWQNLDNAASAQNCSAAPTLVSLTLYPGTSRQATVNISPKTLGWKYAYNLFAKSQTPILPYSSSIFLLNGDNYLVQDLVNALTAFTSSAAAVGSQLDILTAGYYQTSSMTWAGTMSSTFTAYLN